MDETPSSRVRSGGKELRRYVGESRPFESNDENLDRPTLPRLKPASHCGRWRSRLAEDVDCASLKHGSEFMVVAAGPDKTRTLLQGETRAGARSPTLAFGLPSTELPSQWRHIFSISPEQFRRGGWNNGITFLEEASRGEEIFRTG